MPKFDLYNGHGDPVDHLRGYCIKMRGSSGKDELLMAYFSQSLSGAALEWYTRQDGSRWREQAVRVNPPMEEDEMVKYFLQAQEPTYFGHLTSAMGKLFNDVVKMGEMVEEGLKSSKIMSYSAVRATMQAIRMTQEVWHDIEKCWHLKRAIQGLIDANQIIVQINQNPLPSHAETHMIEIVRKDRESGNSSESIMMIHSSEETSKDIGASRDKPKVVVPGNPRKHVVVVKGAPITPVVIKPVTQLPVVDTKVVPWNYKQVIVIYKGKEVEEEVNETGGMTRSGRCFTMEELRKAKHFKDSQIRVKKPVTEEEVEEFLKNMKVQDYSIVEQLRKTPTQISLLSLLIHSDDHCKALMKILNEAYVPDKITVNHLEKIANKIFKANRITFSDDELPMEGTEHNRGFYLTVKCEESVVSRVLVDNRSSENIFPLSTLQKLKISTERIHMNSVCVRGFDRGGKDSVGDIMLELSIGPVKFTMEFQVLDMVVSYNLLLGRSWRHVAKAVPSSLHQMVKFEWDRQEIVVHDDEDISAYNDPHFPFIEVEDDKWLWVYQTFETVSVEKIPEGECIPGPKLSSASVMVANEMLKNGFVPGKGMGSSLWGIVHPVCPRENIGTFGLGFTPTQRDVKRAKNQKQKA
ncbi:uncharacterized protein [Nicotiana tomentosiformis]|uniref:uncharacterized protein n=1 Tax=Nicotiana tomentosiformis TaxID=4098 RepID=UPI00051BFAD1|nr:uncharacterized protein LOC104117510 [Nicotiana tomentosiformis]